ncbi:hypothetical protein Tco_0247304 [Tanacetum coccineum]
MNEGILSTNLAIAAAIPKHPFGDNRPSSGAFLGGSDLRYSCIIGCVYGKPSAIEDTIESKGQTWQKSFIETIMDLQIVHHSSLFKGFLVLLLSYVEGMNNGLVTEDHKFASQISALLRDMIAAYDDKLDFIRELKVLPGVIAAVKTTELLNETLWKDDRRLRKLRNLEMDADERAV